MSSFIHDDFLLSSEAAKRLYHDFAENQPIFDYHCHLSPKDLAENRQFKDLFEIWLEGDHYKWRAMRLNGAEERFCTGDASPKEKFIEFAKTVPQTLRNPLYHWTHLELNRYFGINDLLNESTAENVWKHTQEQLTQKEFSSWGILEKMNVKFIGTTDDPNDSLEYHQQLKNSSCPATVAPSFRPDKGILIENTSIWNDWTNQLEVISSRKLNRVSDFKDALFDRIRFFDKMGCRASDHGLERCPLRIASDKETELTYQKAKNGELISTEEAEGFSGNILSYLGECYSQIGWVMQLHLGAIRNVNTGLYNKLGPDVGCDSVGDQQQIEALSCILGDLSSKNALPKTILYNLNPTQNYAFATMCGNFFEAGIKHKVQLGSGWWFLDQWDGMKWQINALSRLGLLSHFVGMLTDSRSMMSYPRHEYFRRLLCQLLGEDIDKGVLPNDYQMIGNMIKNISFSNAQNYFN